MKYKPLLFLLGIFAALSLSAQNPFRFKKSSGGNDASNQSVVLRNAIGINSNAIEFAPIPYQSGLVYVTSRRKAGPRDEATNETYFELYYAELDPSGMPHKPEPFSVELNSVLHEGSVTFNHRADKIFFTRNNMKNGVSQTDSKGRVRMKIYEAERGIFDWENIRELPFNDDEYSCIHPSISPDETRLFFSSNMPGGYGGYDLYFTTLIDNQWSDPINLGPEVNTTGNEVFPFIHQSGTLFFTSDGYRGLGGLDIFMIDISGNRWGKVINLGEPFNSKADDLSIYLEPDGRNGFFASNRSDGLGKDDIYRFEAPLGIQGVRAPQKQGALIIAMETENGRKISDAAIRIFERSNDGLGSDQDIYDLQLAPSGKQIGDSLIMKYVLKKEDELGPPRVFTNRIGEALVELEEHKDYILLVTKPGYHSQEVPYSPRENRYGRPLEVRLKASNCLTLYGVVLTDQIDQPIANATVRVVNECSGQVDFVQTKINGRFEYCLESGCNYTLFAEKTGFQSNTSKVSTVRIRGSRSLVSELRLKPGSEEVLKEPIREGTVIILEDLYYDFGKSSIRTKDTRALDALVKLMQQYPSMEIELGAHTDSRGSQEYNLKLSLKRAESAKNYLVERGIASRRIRPFGYGEAYPRNQCSDGVECSEEEYQYNRRTEVKITRIDEAVRLRTEDSGLEIVPRGRN